MTQLHKNPLLMKCYELTQAIEVCGASPELTHAVTKAGELMEGIDKMIDAIALAYGHLWHVNNEPSAPIPTYSKERAAYEARRALRDMMTNEHRGQAITAVKALIYAQRPATPVELFSDAIKLMDALHKSARPDETHEHCVIPGRAFREYVDGLADLLFRANSIGVVAQGEDMQIKAEG